MKTNGISAFLLMHAGFLIYSTYTLIGKFASRFEFLSLNFCLLYCAIIFILFIYAVIWQQVLKYFKLSFAMCNKAATIIWGMIFSALIFGEKITIKKILGVIIIFCGIVLLSICNTNNKAKEEVE